jgi:glycosyltransferase involved in cell wall biosynthesis
MKVLFLCPYPIGEAASQRFRFEQYFSILKQRKIEFDTAPFLNEKAWKVLYEPGHFFKKILYILIGFLKRTILISRISQYDYIFIHREAAPLGPPIFEWFIGKLKRKKIVFDFDDAIWIPNSSESNSLFSFIKFHSKTKYISKIAYKVSCGNHYLCEYASQFNSQIVYNPTTIDTENLHNKTKDHNNNHLVIGWTGSHSTNKYLFDMVPVLKKLEEKYQFTFCVISDKNPELNLKCFTFCKWNKDTEISDLLKLDVGIMPLDDDKWANGKCGFKALQYMALGIPALVSPVGVNTKIVDHGINGFICNDHSDWYNYLEVLITDQKLLIELGKNTRKKIENEYSTKSNKENFIKLFQ